jgi:1-deoxyxylulose-5-phosphate synthase
VSVLSLGTAALGIDYGLPGGSSAAPSLREAAAVVERALRAGITFFDTAPAYGTAEALLGEVLAGESGCEIATKVTIPRPGEDSRTALGASLERSLACLKRDRVAVLMLHSATGADLRNDALLSALVEARDAGLSLATGATVYDEAAALAAIESGVIDVLQVAHNLVDQRMAARVFPAAARHGVAIVTRSVLLKGALTPRGRALPPSMAQLRTAVDETRQALGVPWEALPELALRFCLSEPPPVASVLIGARNPKELHTALDALAHGPLDAARRSVATRHALTDDSLLNPARWPAA